MAYEKTTWATGDVITAEKLNHAEDGIASANDSGKIEIVSEQGEISASYNDLVAWITAGITPFLIAPVNAAVGDPFNTVMYLSQYRPVEGGYYASFSNVSLDENGEPKSTIIPLFSATADGHMIVD